MKFVFIHGYMSNPEADWYLRVRAELEKLGHEVSIPAMPGHKHPEAEKWLEIIKRETGSNDEVVLVGHSLGTRAIVLYLAGSGPSRLKKVFLIAPPHIREHSKPDNAWQQSVDLDKLRGFNFTVLASRNDPVVKFEYSKSLADKLGAKFIETDGHRHFTTPEDAEIILETISS